MIDARQLYRLAYLLPLLALCLASAASAEYPERDIELIIPFNPGGGFDSYVRALAPLLEQHLPNGVRVRPRNSPGAGGRRGTTEVYRARPDGYTIGAFNLPGVLIPQLQDDSVAYDLSRVTWLATLSEDPYVYAVRADSPLRSMQDVVGTHETILYGATGPGSTSYIATTIVNARLAIPFEIVTGYTGSSAYMIGLLRGDVGAVLMNESVARAFVESGDIRVLAIFGATSDDPAITDADHLGAPELGSLSLVRMIGGPPGLPDDVRQTLEDALGAALRDPAFQSWLDATGNDATPVGAAETAATVREMAQFYENFKQLLD